MVIKREINGEEIEITLTPAELTKAYREKDAEFKLADFRSKIAELIASEEDLDFDKWYDELPQPEGEISERAKKLRKMWAETGKSDVEYFEEILSDNDRFWECYWDTMEDIIEENLRQ